MNNGQSSAVLSTSDKNDKSIGLHDTGNKTEGSGGEPQVFDTHTIYNDQDFD